MNKNCVIILKNNEVLQVSDAIYKNKIIAPFIGCDLRGIVILNEKNKYIEIPYDKIESFKYL